MMGFLIFDVLKNLFQLRFANGVCGITGLSCEFFCDEVLFIDMMRSATFYLFNDIRN